MGQGELQATSSTDNSLCDQILGHLLKPEERKYYIAATLEIYLSYSRCGDIDSLCRKRLSRISAASQLLPEQIAQINEEIINQYNKDRKKHQQKIEQFKQAVLEETQDKVSISESIIIYLDQYRKDLKLSEEVAGLVYSELADEAIKNSLIAKATAYLELQAKLRVTPNPSLYINLANLLLGKGNLNEALFFVNKASRLYHQLNLVKQYQQSREIVQTIEKCILLQERTTPHISLRKFFKSLFSPEGERTNFLKNSGL